MIEDLESRLLFAVAPITGFTLMNADNDQPVPGHTILSNGELIDLAKVPTQNMSIRANVGSTAPGSIKFTLDGDSSTENSAPYVIASDYQGDIQPMDHLSVGTHTLTGTPYSGKSASGTAGTKWTVNFTVINSGIAAAPSQSPSPTPTSTPSPAGGKTLVVGSGQQYGSISSAINAASAGDLVLVKAGHYNETLNLTRSGTYDKPITIAAENNGSVIVDANGSSTIVKGGASYIRLKGLTFEDAHNDLQQAAVSVGKGWQLTDCVVQNNDSQAINVWGSDVKLTRVTAQFNGQIGISGANCSNVTLLDCVTHDNNQGKSNPVWAGKSHSVKSNGLWYTDASWEAGGGKWFQTDHVTVDHLTSYNNRGPGIIFDWNNTNIVVRNSYVHDNGGLNSYEGMGIHIEMNNAGPTLVEDNKVEDNPGGDIVVRSSKHVTVRNNTFKNATLLLVDWDRGSGYFISDVKVTGNAFQNSYVLTQSDNWGTSSGRDKQITIDGNSYSGSGRLFRWDNTDYWSLSDVRNKLGFEWNGWIG
jgi:hypothetical protein